MYKDILIYYIGYEASNGEKSFYFSFNKSNGSIGNNPGTKQIKLIQKSVKK